MANGLRVVRILNAEFEKKKKKLVRRKTEMKEKEICPAAPMEYYSGEQMKANDIFVYKIRMIALQLLLWP